MTNRQIAKILAGVGVVLVTVAGIGLMGRFWRESGPIEAVSVGGEASEGGRIISMAPNLTEILYTMGLGERLAAVSSDSDFPEAAERLPKVGSFWQPDLEAIVARRPSLVVTLGFGQQTQAADKLRSMGIETLTVNIESIDGLMEAIGQIGEAAGEPEAAAQLIEQLRGEIAAIREQYAGRDKPRVLWVIQRDPLRAAGQETFITEMLEIVGALNALGPTLHQYPPIDAEQVLAARPEVIIEPVEEPGVDALAEARAFYNRYKGMPAVRDGRIYLVEADLVSRLGPRLVEGLRLIAERVWPEERGDEGS